MGWFALVLLLLLALGLIVVEILFIPGTTLFGIAGVMLTIIAFWISLSSLGVTTTLGLLAGFGLLSAGVIYYSLKKRSWDRFALRNRIQSRVNDEKRFVLHIGEVGHTISALRPSGKAEFGNHIVEVHTLGKFLDANKNVRVVRIDHNKIFVENIE